MGGHAFYNGGGGAVLAMNMRNVTIGNSIFSKCSAPNGAGGAVLVILEEALLRILAQNHSSTDVRRFQIFDSTCQDSQAGYAGGEVAFVSNESTTPNTEWLISTTNMTGGKVLNELGTSVFGGGCIVALVAIQSKSAPASRNSMPPKTC